MKPTRSAVMKRHRITDEKSARFVRAYEAAVVEAIENLLRTHAVMPAEPRRAG